MDATAPKKRILILGGGIEEARVTSDICPSVPVVGGR